MASGVVRKRQSAYVKESARKREQKLKEQKNCDEASKQIITYKVNLFSAAFRFSYKINE